MAVKPYMPFYTSEYMNDTAHLTMAEHGAYLLMIIHYWHTEKPLPDDDKKLAQICRTTLKGFRQIKLTVSLLFTQRGNTLVHKRVERELSEYRRKLELSRLGGRKTAEKRWGNKDSIANSIAIAKLQHSNMPSNRHTDTEDIDLKSEDLTLNSEELNSEKTLKTVDPTPPTPPKTKKKRIAPVGADSQPVKLAARQGGVIQQIFEFWKKALGHPRAQLDPKRRMRIENALKRYDPEFLCQAIAGCTKSPHHMGDNDSGKRWDDIELIFRNASNIERFHGYFENPPISKPTGDRVLAHNEAVLQQIYREEEERERREREAKDVTER